MTDIPLLAPDELNNLMSRIDGDSDTDGFLGFELAILLVHLKKNDLMELAPDWYKTAFDGLVQTGVVDSDGNLQVSLHSLFWETLQDGLVPYHKKTPPAE